MRVASWARIHGPLPASARCGIAGVVLFGPRAVATRSRPVGSIRVATIAMG